MSRFDGRVLQLTGAASGIGRATALKAAEQRASLFLSDVAAEGLEERVKRAVHAFTRALAVEYAGRGLRANAISPASIETRMRKPQPMPEGADFELLNRLSSLHGPAGPEVVADLVLFLASDEATQISGEEIRIDGAALA